MASDPDIADPYVEVPPPEVASAEAPPPRSAAGASSLSGLLRRHGHTLVLVALLVFTLLVRLGTLPMIEMGGDAVKAWFNAKQLTLGIADQFWVWDHHSVRFAIIVPTWLLQEVFGLDPVVYYLFPLAGSLALTAIAYAIGRRLERPAVGFCAAVATVMFSHMERNGAQLLSEVFTGVYALLGVYLLLRYRDTPASRTLIAVGLSLVMFAAYMTKLTNVLFVPGFAVGLWLFGKRWRDVAIFLGLLLALFCVETLLYRTLTQYSLGQLSVVGGSHLKDRRLKPTELSAFFTHVVKLVPEWKVTLIAFTAALIAALAGWRRWGKDAAVIALVPALFLLLQNFAVKSVDPLIPVQRFLSRYLLPALPLLMLSIAWVVALLVEEAQKRWRPEAPHLPGWARPTAAAVVLLAFLGLTFGLRFNGVADHPFTLLAAWDTQANAAFAKGTPVVGLESPKDPDFFLKVLWTDLRRESFTGGGLPRLRNVRYGKKRAYVVLHPAHEASLEGKKDQEVLDAWLGKKVIKVGHHPHPGPNMGNVFDLKIAKLKKP